MNYTDTLMLLFGLLISGLLTSDVVIAAFSLKMLIILDKTQKTTAIAAALNVENVRTDLKIIAAAVKAIMIENTRMLARLDEIQMHHDEPP